jgi:MFS transporter, DHA3 family, macrolide efflux protein
MFCYERFLGRVAQNAANFALVLLIVDATDQAFMSSLMVLTLVVPSTLAGLVAGSAADRLPRRLLIVLSNIARAGLCLLIVQGSDDTRSLYLIGALLSIAAQFSTLPEAAIQPLIVEKDELARANAIGHAVGGAAQVVGLGILAPVILRVFESSALLFAVAAALFLAAAFFVPGIGRIRAVARAEVGGAHEGRWWLAGYRAMRADRLVWQAASELTLIGATMIVLGGLIPTYISDTLGLPVAVGAVVLLPAVAGVVTGLRVAGALSHRVPHALLSSAGFGTFVVLLAMLTFVDVEASFLAGYPTFAWLGEVNIGNFDQGGVLALMLMFPAGFSFAIVTVAAQTVLNDRVPLQLQGRVGATQNAMAAIASSLPVLLAGFMADVVGVTPVMAVLAGGIGLAAVVNLRQPHIREAAATLPVRPA